ncbi:hypothetical protein Pla52o_17660 [Novipirellula galeiformis]|uniref:DUF1269 domain-containing protein n=1 Tax=Novipirellula galeiformis TaxID=2528004 RepID=A0A5C6CN08_9BACT|nr:DUF1269 domain-containing protein [Novipirellula galeiformis]TWU25465.1 hypothetical protein Pla52o_17660 [Novipirellula galeiformis]
MNAECLVAVYPSLAKAQVGLEVLETFDFASDAVSTVWRGREEALEHLNWEQGAQNAQDVVTTMALGAFISGAVAVPFAVATMIIPVIITGPLVAIAGGATMGGVLGEARHWGIHRHASKSYEQQIADGAVLVIVTSTKARIDEAQQGLQTTHPSHLDRFAYQHAIKLDAG